jgi:hypothetical protein
MISNKTFIATLVLSTAFAVSACGTETSYAAPTDRYVYATNLGYPYECDYGFGYECSPYVYDPPVFYDFDHFDHFHQFSHFHDHQTNVGHGLGAFVSHGFAGHGGHGGGGQR